MPFASLYRPTIALSLLKAGLLSRGISSTILYFTIKFAERVGPDLYVRLSNQAPLATDLVGEWIFSDELFPKATDDYIEKILGPSRPMRGRPYEDLPPVDPGFLVEIQNAKKIAADFLNSCCNQILSLSPRILAFTSVFQQHVSSLALAKLVKAKRPETFIVFGGSNCEGIMGAELKRSFSFVDAVVSGEGDIVFPQIVQRVFNGTSVSDLRGVYTQENCCLANANDAGWRADPVMQMDELPVPDYDDFFAQHDQSILDPVYQRQILFETSRGCWWGERSHCTFCGLSKEAMSYRSKSQGRALEEITSLGEKYPNCVVTVVDDILDLKYFREFLPELAAKNLDLQLFYETKANLKKAQVRLLQEAGVTMIQPGIESFSDSVLSIMRKGVSALQNIQLLKWCREFSIMPYWNILWGFPGEDEAEYLRMAELIPLLTHLPPPQCTSRIRLDRFSPNFKFAEQYGFTNVKPYPSYHHVYTLSEEAVTNLAYFFTYDYLEPRDAEGYTRALRAEVAKWWEFQETSALFCFDKESHLLFWDLRPASVATLTVLSGLQRLLYLSCDQVCTHAELKKVGQQFFGHSVSDLELNSLIDPLLQRRLLLRDHHSFLSLAVPLGIYTPGPAILQKFYAAVRRLGTVSGERIEINLPEMAYSMA